MYRATWTMYLSMAHLKPASVTANLKAILHSISEAGLNWMKANSSLSWLQWVSLATNSSDGLNPDDTLMLTLWLCVSHWICCYAFICIQYNPQGRFICWELNIWQSVNCQKSVYCYNTLGIKFLFKQYCKNVRSCAGKIRTLYT